MSIEEYLLSLEQIRSELIDTDNEKFTPIIDFINTITEEAEALETNGSDIDDSFRLLQSSLERISAMMLQETSLAH